MAKDVEVKFTVTGVDGSIKDLSDLVNALNKTEKATEDLNNETKKQSEESSGLENRIKGIKDTYKGLVSSLKFATKGIKTFFTSGTVGANILKVSLAALGIPLLIAGIAALVNYFKNFEVVTRTLSKIMNGLGAVVGSVGKAFSLIARGKFSEAFDTIKNSVVEAVEATDALYDSEKRLADLRKANLQQNAQLRQEIEGYKKILEDTTLSEGKRLKALDEVTKRTKQLAENQLAENQALIDGLEAKIAIENNEVARRDLEVELAELRAERISQQTELNNIEYDAAKVGREIRAQAQAERDAAKAKEAEELQKQKDAEAAALEKKLANEKMIQEQLEQLRLDGIDDQFEKARQELDIQEQKAIEQLRLANATEEQITQAEAAYAKKREKLAKEESDYKIGLAEAEEDAKLDLAVSALGAITELVGESSAVGKAAAIAATVINTYRGAQAAFAETPGGIAIKSIAAGVAVASGLANVRKIVQTETPGGKSAGSAPNISARPARLNTGLGANNVLGGIAGNNVVTPEAQINKVYVVAEDVTSQQEATKKVKDLARL